VFLIKSNLGFALTLCLMSPLASAESDAIPTLPDQINVPEEYLAIAKQAKERVMDSPVMKARVSEVMQEVNSDQWQARKNEFLSLLRADAGLDAGDPENPDPEATGSRALLFVSSSIPEITLRNYARDLEKVGGVMVMRGMIGGLKKTQPTMEFMAKVLRKNPTCEGPKCAMRGLDVVIDPIQFRNHNITKVPALVVEQNFDFQSYCEKGAATPGMQLPVVYGDSSLQSLLKRLTTMTGGAPAESILAKLENPNAQ